jgi:uncharacterized protein (TIGR00375 family)
MKFIADLHVHSKFSIATAKNLDLENLYIAAQKKGIAVVGTGDFTHPAWRAELKEKLIPLEPGLYRLKKEIEKECDPQVPKACRRPVRFILTAEISNIYKKGEKTRKNHNLILMPSLNTADLFSDALDRIGNIKSDGRPILGLDARDLLEIMLETSDQAMFIPAHIWTPWFSLLGSKSGFNSVEECFEDLSNHIFAVETGLSSDPAMNWRVSNLDRMTLVSNSDAHSPMKLGREANIFNTDLSYDAIRTALITGDPALFKGTIEFFPEEGKYHLDGHRKCQVRFSPTQTMNAGGICPECGKPLTVGVLNRVEEIADHGEGRRPDKTHPYRSIVPLVDIISRILNVGVNSKKVQGAYHQVITALGDEFSILLHHPIDMIEKKANIPLLGEAIRRMREKQIDVTGGYDGEFGKIRFFNEKERRRLSGQKGLFADDIGINNPQEKNVSSKKGGAKRQVRTENRKPIPSKEKKTRAALNPAQRKAVEHGESPLIIAAGPGTGKTMTITRRMAHLIKEKKVDPHDILAVTFTNKAAEEMRVRLKKELSSPDKLPTVATFHALCLDLLTDQSKKQPPENALMVIDEDDRDRLVTDAIDQISGKTDKTYLTPRAVSRIIMTAKQQILGVGDIITGQGQRIDRWVARVYAAYQNILKILAVVDYEDLIFNVVTYLEARTGPKNSDLKNTDQEKADRQQFETPQFKYMFVDEYQDVNEGQYRLVRAMVPENGTGLCVIGDPDQSIYGFRGSDVRFFKRFISDFPQAKQIRLNQNYRSVETILRVSARVIRPDVSDKTRKAARVYSGLNGIRKVGVYTCATERAEASTIGKRIVHLIGGRGYHDLDLGRVDNAAEVGGYGFEDMAVLYRTRRQGDILADVFQKMGLPYQIVQRRRRHPYKKVRQMVSLLTVLEGRPLYRDINAIRDLFEDAPSANTLKIFKTWGLKRNLAPGQAFHQARIQAIENMTPTRQRRLDQMIRQIKTLQTKLQPIDVGEKLSALIEQFNFSTEDKDEPGLAEAMAQLTRKAQTYHHRTTAFLSDMALETDTDTYNKKARTITLMTMHAAKGLEFPVVFIAGCEDGLVPFCRSEDEAGDVGEERRLFYVAITRAKEELFFTWAKTRSRFGKRKKQDLSPFIRFVEGRLLDQHDVSGVKRRPVQRSLFAEE